MQVLKHVIRPHQGRMARQIRQNGVQLGGRGAVLLCGTAAADDDQA